MGVRTVESKIFNLPERKSDQTKHGNDRSSDRVDICLFDKKATQL